MSDTCTKARRSAVGLRVDALAPKRGADLVRGGAECAPGRLLSDPAHARDDVGGNAVHLRARSARGRLPLLAFALSLVALAAWAIPGAAAVLQFDRGALAAGELWRSVTGHWAHWGGDHLAWDLVVFAVFGALLERRSRRGFAAVVAGSAVAISVAVWVAAPEIWFYRGLSGIDSALFAAFFAQLLRDAWRERSLLQAFVPVLALMGFVGKSALELATGSTLFVETSAVFVAVPLAHLVGAAAGVGMVGGTVRTRGPTLPQAMCDVCRD